MRVVVRHGHFAFYPRKKEDLLHFKRLFGLTLEVEDDYLTFAGLIGLPRWSQALRPYGNLLALETIEARYPWEVMRRNGFVYSLATELLTPYSLVTQQVSLPQSRDFAIAPKPLVQPGSILPDANVLLGYQGTLDLDVQKLYIESQETLL